MMNGPEKEIDPFLQGYNRSDLQTASEFLSNWLPFLSKGLCDHCSLLISDRVGSLTTPPPREEYDTEEVKDINDNEDTISLGSGKDGANGVTEQILENYGPEHVEKRSPSPRPRMSWADMVQEEMEIEETDEEEEARLQFGNIRLQEAGEVKVTIKPPQQQLSREERERIRFNNVIRKKDYICLERVNGRIVNILDGLELHTHVFSVAEQKRIVDFVYQLQEKGKMKELKARTFTAPHKWMKGKGRVTIQFGCCYNYATDKSGNPPGILHNELVDPIPHLFKVIIKRLVTWHVLPPTCVPDSCIVNIYDEGDCIPPHIDNHDFLRPFCTVSFLSECNILFGTNLKIEGPGEFSGAYKIPLPVGSVLVLNGNGANVANHCVPAVPTKRISITFRKMDESKWPAGFVPEPDLQGLEPLPPNNESVQPKPVHPPYRQAVRRDETRDNSRRLVLGSQPRFYGQSQTRQQGPSSGNLRRTRLEY